MQAAVATADIAADSKGYSTCSCVVSDRDLGFDEYEHAVQQAAAAGAAASVSRQ
jgi:hypothetical protein